MSPPPENSVGIAPKQSIVEMEQRRVLMNETIQDVRDSLTDKEKQELFSGRLRTESHSQYM